METIDWTGAYGACLVGLPGMTPVHLAKILSGTTPTEAWAAVCAGTHPADPRHKFLRSARDTDVDAVARAYAGAGVSTLLPGTPGYPSALEGDPGAPAVLFALGDPQAGEGRPRVAIVGTRTPTPYGLQVASEMAADLAARGVTVVSGLAVGIDGAAHAGVIRGTGPTAGPPVAVAGTGLDVPYPSQNEDLWNEVVARGVVFSESALGTPPLPRVFPARNRIIAALSDVVVVVECHRKGGSIYTVEAAARRSIPVCAVPGSVRSRASDGTNGLLVDGCAPVRDATDVLVALELACAGTGRFEGVEGPHAPVRPVPSEKRGRNGSGATAGGRSRSAQPSLSQTQGGVLAAVDDTPTAFETILIRTGLSVAAAAQACDELEDLGLLLAGAGWWSKV